MLYPYKANQLAETYFKPWPATSPSQAIVATIRLGGKLAESLATDRSVAVLSMAAILNQEVGLKFPWPVNPTSGSAGPLQILPSIAKTLGERKGVAPDPSSLVICGAYIDDVVGIIDKVGSQKILSKAGYESGDSQSLNRLTAFMFHHRGINPDTERDLKGRSFFLKPLDFYWR